MLMLHVVSEPGGSQKLLPAKGTHRNESSKLTVGHVVQLVSCTIIHLL